MTKLPEGSEQSGNCNTEHEGVTKLPEGSEQSGNYNTEQDDTDETCF